MVAISDSTGFVDSVVTLAERLSEIGIDDAVIMDGYNDCVIGVLERFGMEPIVLYDKAKIIDKLIEDGCDDYEGANEFYEFNQLGAWVGDKTPGFLVRLSDAT